MSYKISDVRCHEHHRYWQVFIWVLFWTQASFSSKQENVFGIFFSDETSSSIHLDLELLEILRFLLLSKKRITKQKKKHNKTLQNF